MTFLVMEPGRYQNATDPGTGRMRPWSKFRCGLPTIWVPSAKIAVDGEISKQGRQVREALRDHVQHVALALPRPRRASWSCAEFASRPALPAWKPAMQFRRPAAISVVDCKCKWTLASSGRWCLDHQRLAVLSGGSW